MGKMKAIKILGILVFVMFMVTALKDAVPGFIDGWNEAGAVSYTHLTLPTIA